MSIRVATCPESPSELPGVGAIIPALELGFMSFSFDRFGPVRTTRTFQPHAVDLLPW